MKILMISGVFPPRGFGGTTAVSHTLAKKLVERGHEVTVYTTDVGDDRGSRLNVQGTKIINGINVHYFKNISNSLAFKHRLFLPIRMISAIRKDIANFDIIHIHGFRGVQDVITHHYAPKYNIPYVLHGHGSIPRSVSKKGIKRIFDVLFGYRIIRDASKLIAVSKEEGEHYKQMGAGSEKISVIYNGMDIESFKNLPKYERFRKKYGINGRMILYLGRINKSKGIDFAIRAFSKLIEEVDDVILVIAGPDDGYKTELEKLMEKLNIRDKVKFTGHVNEDDKISAYVDADLFVHTVRYMGGVGLTPLEAILSGTPVIVTEECGEVIKEAKCGYLVEYGDIEGLKEKMKWVIENPEEGEEMVERGKWYIEENLTWDKVVRRVEEVYEDCIESE